MSATRVVEKVPPSGLNLAPHSVLAGPLPFEAGNELAGHCEHVTEDVGEGLARRLLHGEDLHLREPTIK